MTKLNQVSATKILYALVGSSLLYFLLKGFKYAYIGSYVPALFIVAIVIILSWSFTKSSKTHRRALRFWAIVILVWAILRLGLWGYLKIDTNLTESHLREQFGIVQNVISILMLVIGIRILKEVKTLKISDNANHKKNELL